MDEDHYRNLCRLVRSVGYFGASRSVVAREGRANGHDRLPSCRASGSRMRIRLSAHSVVRRRGETYRANSFRNNGKPPNLIASVIRNTAHFADRRVTAKASLPLTSTMHPV